MKPEEALKYLKGFIDNEEPQIGTYNTEVLKNEIVALEKQVPKKPKETDAYPRRLFCPTCYFTFCFNKMNIDGIKQIQMYNYCPECGQAIDWYDVDMGYTEQLG